MFSGAKLLLKSFLSDILEQDLIHLNIISENFNVPKIQYLK